MKRRKFFNSCASDESNITLRLTHWLWFISAWVIAMRRSTGSRRVIRSATALTSGQSVLIRCSTPLRGDPRFEALAEKIVPTREFRAATKVKIDTFFAELKRRNVYKVAIAYIVGGWALSQGIAQVFPVFDVPNSAIRAIVLLIILGLPVALVLAWMFELTPEGIKRTETADAMPAAAKPKKYVWIYLS